MIDNGPYIIVDDRKIAPMAPSSRTGRNLDDRREAGNQPFGVVDRVTISDAARERLKQADALDVPPPTLAPTSRPGQPSNSALLLTYAPKRY